LKWVVAALSALGSFMDPGEMKMKEKSSRCREFSRSLVINLSVVATLVLTSSALAQSTNNKLNSDDRIIGSGEHNERVAALRVPAGDIAISDDSHFGLTPSQTPLQTLSIPVIAPPSNAARVSCNGNPGDAVLIQNAIESHSAVSVKGTCNLGVKTLTFGSGFYLGGPATLNYTGSGFAVASSGNNNVVSGLTFRGGGLHLSLNDRTNWTGQYGWTIQGNAFEDITNGTSAIYVSNIIGKGSESSISYNKFTNIWPGGYPNFPSGYSAQNCVQDCLLGNGAGGSGVWIEMGLDNVKINYNQFDILGGNAIKGFWDGFVGHIDPYEAHHVEIAHNVMTRIHRIGIEIQTVGRDLCPGGCNFSLMPNDGTVIKDNFYHNPAFTGDPFGFSLMVGGTNVQIINNTAVDEDPTCYLPLGIGLENTMNGGLLQGNVTSAVYQNCTAKFNRSHGWAGTLVSGYTSAGYTDNFYNNFACGDGVKKSTLISSDPQNSATMNERADYGSTTCPESVASTHISILFTSSDHQSFTGLGPGTFNVALTSTLSIQFVQFVVDDSRNPVVTQEVQDFNPNFPLNPQWLYHATVDLSGLKSGVHRITAVATDVAGGMQTTSQSFMTKLVY
jgi:hypothetical protein